MRSRNRASGAEGLIMDAKTAIPADEYPHTSFPGVDPEYRQGE